MADTSLASGSTIPSRTAFWHSRESSRLPRDRRAEIGDHDPTPAPGVAPQCLRPPKKRTSLLHHAFPPIDGLVRVMFPGRFLKPTHRRSNAVLPLPRTSSRANCGATTAGPHHRHAPGSRVESDFALLSLSTSGCRNLVDRGCFRGRAASTLRFRGPDGAAGSRFIFPPAPQLSGSKSV